MITGSRNSQQSSSIWPGYVDVLSALLMVVIFVLLIFTFAQFLLSYIVSDQSSELDSLHVQIEEITQLLGLERDKNKMMFDRLGSLNRQIELLTIDRTDLRQKVGLLEEEKEITKTEMENQLKTIASLQQDVSALQNLRKKLEQEIALAASTLQREQQLSFSLRDRSKALEEELAGEQELTLLAQRDIEQRDIRIEALAALVGEQKEKLSGQKQLTADARAEVALLSEQINRLREQLSEINLALSISEEKRAEQDEEIKNLGDRLNIELARQVNELERYKSDFFGRLRQIVDNNPLVRIEGDRFLLQSELLFASGTARLGDAGRLQLMQLAEVLNALIPSIPQDLPWILRIDGHTDKQPMNSTRFQSNWELSMARAVTVVRYLAEHGVPEDRMAAAGFSKFHPIDPGDSPEAYSKNRRIEIKLTSK